MKAKMPKGATKPHILQIAGNLFYRLGIRAVGIDTIVAESGVAKTTLYDHFPSKDDLIVAYLQQYDQIFWQAFEQTAQQHPDNPKQQLLDLFDSFDQLIRSEEFLGCPFLSAVAEFPELNQPGHQVAIAHKQSVRDRFYAMAQHIGAHDPHQLADQLLLILDGAYASKRVFRDAESPAKYLKPTIEAILSAHLR
jgi:AcrR family transcriptional regulator